MRLRGDPRSRTASLTTARHERVPVSASQPVEPRTRRRRGGEERGHAPAGRGGTCRWLYAFAVVPAGARVHAPGVAPLTPIAPAPLPGCRASDRVARHLCGRVKRLLRESARASGAAPRGSPAPRRNPQRRVVEPARSDYGDAIAGWLMRASRPRRGSAARSPGSGAGHVPYEPRRRPRRRGGLVFARERQRRPAGVLVIIVTQRP